MNARKTPMAGSPDAAAGDRAALEALVLRDTALTESEVAFFKQVFRAMMKTHFDRVWHVLVRKGVRGAALDDLVQETFAASSATCARTGSRATSAPSSTTSRRARGRITCAAWGAIP